MKNIILVDPIASGHHLSYIRLYCDLFIEIGCNVIILTPDIDGVKKYLDSCFPVPKKCYEIYKLNRRSVSSYERKLFRSDGLRADLSKAYYAFRDFWDVRDAIVSNKIKGQSRIFFLWFDAYLSRRLPRFLVDLVLPCDFAGLYFHPSRALACTAYGSGTRDVLFAFPALKSKKLRFVGVFDEKIMHRLTEIYRRDIFDVLPDVAQMYPPRLDDPLIVKILDSAGGRKIIVLVGALDRRKNLLTFFRAARESGGEVFFVCVGKLNTEWFSASELEEIQKITDSCKDRLYFYDGYIESDQVFDSVIYVSSIIFAAYYNFTSSSNMIYKAALHKIPVIVSADHLMGEQVRTYNIGAALDKVTPQSVLNAINKLLDNTAPYGFDYFLADNSREKLNAKLRQRVC